MSHLDSKQLLNLHHNYKIELINSIINLIVKNVNISIFLTLNLSYFQIYR